MADKTLSQLTLITSVTGDEYVYIEQGGNSRRVALSTILHAASLIATPIGTMLSWPTETAPVGFLVRSGMAISRTTYADLFAVIGTMYGSGDGSTTFNLPNHLGAFERSFANGSSNDPDRASRTNRGDGTTGDHVGTWQASQNLSHAHNYTDPGHNHPTSLNLASASATNTGSYTDFVRVRNEAGNTGTHTIGITISQNGGNQSNPVNYTTLPIIRAY